MPTVPACSHGPDTRGGAATPHGLVAASVVKMRGDPATHAPGHAAGEPLELERTARRKDGSTFVAHLRGHAIDPANPPGDIRDGEVVRMRRRDGSLLMKIDPVTRHPIAVPAEFTVSLGHPGGPCVRPGAR